jgi:hypothetical protein
MTLICRDVYPMERGSADASEIKYEILVKRPKIMAVAKYNLLLPVISPPPLISSLFFLKLNNPPPFLTFHDCNVCEKFNGFYFVLFDAAP